MKSFLLWPCENLWTKHIFFFFDYFIYFSASAIPWMFLPVSHFPIIAIVFSFFDRLSVVFLFSVFGTFVVICILCETSYRFLLCTVCESVLVCQCFQIWFQISSYLSSCFVDKAALQSLTFVYNQSRLAVL